MNRSQKRNVITIIGIILIGISAYLGFGPLFDIFQDGVTSQFLAAIFGTVFTIILTMFLLNKQTEIEEEKSRGESVFQERVELYKDIIKQMKEIVQDGAISIKEMSELQFMLVQLQMLSEDSTIEKFTKVYDSIATAFAKVNESEDDDSTDAYEGEDPESKLEPEDTIEILKSMLKFSKECRLELGLSSSTKDNQELFSKTSDSLKKSQTAVVEKKIGGQRGEIKLEVKGQLSEYLQNNLQKSQYWKFGSNSEVYFKGNDERELVIWTKFDNIRFPLVRLNPLPPKKDGEPFKYKVNMYRFVYNDYNAYDQEKDDLGLIKFINSYKPKFEEIFKQFGFEKDKNFFLYGRSKAQVDNLKLTLSCYKEIDLDSAFTEATYKDLNDFICAYSGLTWDMMSNGVAPYLEAKGEKLNWLL